MFTVIKGRSVIQAEGPTSTPFQMSLEELGSEMLLFAVFVNLCPSPSILEPFDLIYKTVCYYRYTPTLALSLVMALLELTEETFQELYQYLDSNDWKPYLTSSYLSVHELRILLSGSGQSKTSFLYRLADAVSMETHRSAFPMLRLITLIRQDQDGFSKQAFKELVHESPLPDICGLAAEGIILKLVPRGGESPFHVTTGRYDQLHGIFCIMSVLSCSRYSSSNSGSSWEEYDGPWKKYNKRPAKPPLTD